MTPASETKRAIRDRAAELGIDGLGFTDSAPLDRVRKSWEEAIGRGYVPSDLVPSESTMVKLTTPTRHLRPARSIISSYEAYFTGEPQTDDPLVGTIARYTTANYYEDLRQRLLQLADWIARQFGARTKVLCCYVTLAEKAIAAKAGVGFYGKQGVIVTPKHGSFVVLGEILTDLELEPDSALDLSCGACTRCIDACPVGALKTAYFVDRELCIQAHCGRRTVIPLAVREAWGNRFYGCTTCQDACPRNARLEPVRRRVEHGRVGAAIPLASVLLISEAEFEARFANNQIGMRDRNTIRRNGIVAAGNSRSEAFLDALGASAEDPDPIIRQHALWAIWRIKGNAARPLLEKALRAEPEAAIRDELKTLLDGISGVL